MNGTVEHVSITIFGGTGDLSYRKLLPALYNLYASNLLKSCFQVVAIGRRDYDDAKYQEIIDPWIREFARMKIDEETLKNFYSHIHYYKMNFTDLNQYEQLDQFYREHPCSNHMMYYAVAPEFFEVITEGVKTLKSVDQPKIIIEKPFGASLDEAKRLNETLETSFGKDHIYRIDHYLGKEMVRNILTIRETNPLFAKVWSKDDIDHVEISAFETVGVETRGNYYDHAGALKDMVQNHLLQIMSVVAMENPENDLKQEQLKVLKTLRPIQDLNIEDTLVLAQYEGYTSEDKVDPNSKTETYAGLKLFLDHPNWKGVPFYIRTGKKLSKREMEVTITFKPIKEGVEPDVLVIKIQPVEGVYLEFNIKTPGEDSVTRARMDFCQNCNLIFRLNTPEAYERMLFACMHGDGSWFSGFEQIELCWKYIEDLKNAYIEKGLPLYTYPQESDGPVEFEQLKK